MNNKKKVLESSFLNMVLVLALVTAFSAVSLGYVYTATKDQIALAKASKQLEAISEVVLSGYTNSPAEDVLNLISDDGGQLECFKAKEGDTITSVAIKTYSKKAFSGDIWLMVGFLPDGAINKISILDQKETPGLGTKIDDDAFKSQFYGKNPAEFRLKVKKDGGDVDAITAATISSRAICDAIARAYDAYMKGKVNYE